MITKYGTIKDANVKKEMYWDKGKENKKFFKKRKKIAVSPWTTIFVTFQRKPKLVVINSANKIRYYKRCKIILDKNAEELIITPREKDAIQITANFDRDFIQHKNILCIDECENDTNKYFLIFSSEEICKNIFDSNEKAKDIVIIDGVAADNDEFFETKFLIPILNECVSNPVLEDQLKPTILELLKFYKAKYSTNISQDFFNQASSNNISLSDTLFSGHGNNSIDTNFDHQRSLQKRPNISSPVNKCNKDYVDGKKNNSSLNHNSEPQKKKSKLLPLKEIIYAPNFEVINYIQNGISKSRLFIFRTVDKKICYEYFCDFKNQYYVCCGCNNGKRTHAIIEKDLNGTDYVKCLRMDHICRIREYKPEKYKTDLIIKKPNYLLIEKRGNGIMKKFLLLFTSKDKKKFYKMTYDSHQKLYVCMKCCNAKNYIQACVCCDENGSEYISVRNRKHICSKVKYLVSNESSIFETMNESKTTVTVPHYQHTIRNSYKPIPKTSKSLKVSRNSHQVNDKKQQSKTTNISTPKTML